MPRPRKRGPRHLRGAPPLETMGAMADDDLVMIAIHAPGPVTTSHGTWPATPAYGVTAHRILIARQGRDD